MAGITTFAANKFLEASCRNNPPTWPTSLSVALFSTMPTAAYTSGSPTGTEITGNAYARQTAVFGAAASGQVLNSGVVTFPTATPANWTGVAGWGAIDGTGNLWFFSVFTGTNDVQTLTMTGTPTGGTVVLSFNGSGNISLAIPYNATALQVQEALESIAGIGAGGVIVTGGPWPASAMTVTFNGSLQYASQPVIALQTNSLTGGTSPTVTAAHTTTGSTGTVTINAGSNLAMAIGALAVSLA